jgi:hypothetical protein
MFPQPAIDAKTGELTPKLKISEKIIRAEHRSGWAYALEALEPLCTPQGILLDTFIEANFGWNLQNAQQQGIVPYGEPWVGFVHNPPGIPEWHEYYSAPQVMFASPAWRESVPYCRGLLTLSETMAAWLRQETGLPVMALVHPTETPAVRFEWSQFTANPYPKIIQVGWWLRRFRSIYELPASRFQRAVLTPVLPERHDDFRDAVVRDASQARQRTAAEDAVLILPYQTHEAFDELLAENLVFLHLYDSVCNNTVVECIVRETPVLVNPLPSVVEYLGAGYPLYFNTLEQAAKKAEDEGCVRAAHDYLRALPKDAFTAEYFRHSLAESDWYRSL